MIANIFPGQWGAVVLGVGNHLWQSTLFALVIAVLAFVLRTNHARTRYWLWLAASMKFLVPFSLLVVLGSHLAWLHHASPRSGKPTNTASLLVIEEMSQPFTMAELPMPPAPAQDRLPFAARAAGFVRAIPPVPAIVFLTWLCGFLVVTVRWSRRALKMRAAIRKALPVSEGREVEALKRMQSLGGLRGHIELKRLPISLEPGIFGILRPVLLWPQAISGRIDDAHLEAILLHEVWHVRRRDNLTALLHMAVEAIFWFHPLVWWLEARLVEEREQACDEEVVLRFDEPGTYAESILKVCEFCVDSPLACISGVAGADLKKRVVRIMARYSAQKLTRKKKLLLATVGLCSAVLPILLGQARAVQAMANSSASPQGQPAAAATSAAFAQSPPPGSTMSFEVASIRQSKPGTYTPPNFAPDTGETYGADPNPHGRLTADLQLLGYLEFAYKLWLTGEQRKTILAGLPKWVSTDNFEINAKAEGDPTKDQMRLMMQSLLADRFGVRVHFEPRQVPVFSLELAKPGKTGPQLRAHMDGSSCYLPLPPSTPGAPPTDDGTTRPPCDFYTWGIRFMPGPAMFLLSRDATMKDVATALPSVGLLERPVVNSTGLSGKFDLTLSWVPVMNGASPSAAGGDPGPTFAEALQDQLGLKLKATNALLNTLVVDHVERPSAN
jgi:bla regulator protein blaR1